MIRVLIPSDKEFLSYKDECKSYIQKCRIKFATQTLLNLFVQRLSFICLLMIQFS